MNNKIYLKKLVSEEANKIKQNRYISKLIKEEYIKITESASEIRDTLDDLDYVEKGNELDNGGPMQSHASELFILFFEYLKKELPNIKIKVTGGNDKFHKGRNSRHIFGEALDLVVTKGSTRDVWKVMKAFKKMHSSDFKCLDEYTNPTEHATGGHFHIAYVGSDSLYNKAKNKGELPSATGNTITYKTTQGQMGDIDGKPINVQDFAAIHKWEGSDSNGTDLAEIDKYLKSLYDLSGGGKHGTSIRLYEMIASQDGSMGEEVKSHKWVVQAKIRVPHRDNDDGYTTKEKQGGQVPDKMGILPARPETVSFYPSGTFYFYNQMYDGDDLELEKTNKWIDRAYNLLYFTAGATLAAFAKIAGYTAKGLEGIQSNVLTIYNNTGDVLGTLYVEPNGPMKGALILDMTDSPQYSVDAGYEQKGSEKWLNIIQTILDFAGFIPIIDIIFAWKLFRSSIISYCDYTSSRFIC